ncbi:MAG: hypothetical protein IPN69_13125 [Acidobacteria bacterium]|nr:hypothetical protein [Acidobacteriota bacterium]
MELGHWTGQGIEKGFVRTGSDRIVFAPIRGNSRANLSLVDASSILEQVVDLQRTVAKKFGGVTSFAENPVGVQD